MRVMGSSGTWKSVAGTKRKAVSNLCKQRFFYHVQTALREHVLPGKNRDYIFFRTIIEITHALGP